MFQMVKMSVPKVRKLACCIAVLSCALIPLPAWAYIGPGAGLGALGIAIAFAVGAVFLVIGLVWYPLRRAFRGRSAASGKSEGKEGSD